MALRPALDLELLRTLVFIAEEASFTKAGERVGRTQSAVTLQVQKLEALVGQPLVIRSKGGPVELTPQGRALVDSARAMLKLNDEAFRALASHELPATVRLGTSSSLIPFYLADSLDLFRSEHPNAVVEVTDGLTNAVLDRGYGRPPQALEIYGGDVRPEERAGSALEAIESKLAELGRRERQARGPRLLN